jgi:hypothetical protein
MAVAEMPGDANEMQRVLAANFRQRLCRRYHFDQPAILEHQRIAAAQSRRILEIEQEFKTAGACHRHSAPVAIVEVENDGVRRRFAPVVMLRDFDRANHSRTSRPWRR